MKATQPMTLSRAAEWLGVDSPDPTRWLRRYLLRRERELRRPIMLRVGQGRARSHYRVTPGALRRFCPALFDPGERAAEKLTTLRRQIEQRVVVVDERVDDVEARLAALAESIRRLSQSRR